MRQDGAPPTQGDPVEPWHIIVILLLLAAAITTAIVLAVRRK